MDRLAAPRIHTVRYHLMAPMEFILNRHMIDHPWDDQQRHLIQGCPILNLHTNLHILSLRITIAANQML